MAAGNTLGKTPSQSAYSGLQNHQLGNGITPPLRACASSRSPRRTSCDWRLAFGVDGCMLGFELAASGLDDSPLRYAFQWMCGLSAAQSQLIGLKCWMGVRSAQTLSRSHDVRRRGASQCWRKIRSVAPLCPACCAARAAGHHGCARKCQAPICLAGSRHTAANGIA